MGSIKDFLKGMEVADNRAAESAVEVFADSVRQALELASNELGIDVTLLDYQILEKGTRGFLGIGRLPYHVLVTPLVDAREHGDLLALERKLSKEHAAGIAKADVDGSFRVRVTRSGIYLTVNPAKGNGAGVTLDEVNNKFYSMKITPSDPGKIEKEVAKPSGKPVKIGSWTANPENDGTMSLEVTDDEMKVFVHFTPPRFSGRHMEYEEVIDAMKKAGVKVGIREKEIREYLENIDYTMPLLAAEGVRTVNGKDAYIEYKVRVDTKGVNFEEDESGKVDFRNLELLENVVVGQLLAVKIPAEQGVQGRTVTNRIIPARSGKDVKIQHGKGTILSEDGTELTAEINGQVTFKAGRISVEPIYVVNGDVSLETGNIVFLGSVIIAGNVQDNFEVKAAGNIEVRGTVQKAFLEAEGDIIVFQGIIGRDEAKIESTGGNVYAKFIQNASVFAETDVIVPEGIMHSNVDAGGRVCSLGKRARIVGGVIRAGDEVNARFLGADVSTRTEVRVGIHPKVLQQLSDLTGMKAKIEEEQTHLKLDLRTLETQKRNAGNRLPAEREKMLKDLQARNTKLNERMEEIKGELDEVNSYISMIEHKGRVCAEQTAFGGLEIYIKDKTFFLKDPYNHVKFSLQGDQIRISEYEQPEGMESRMIISRRRR
ncbi:MAG TPA: FapA family protein [Spirochaetota bacterium]|nr:FapA family protein [Spirochaetota bacterium]HOD13869.1 FapA family protein [Spirochaetota bacterium]HPG52123.1 FapA family protein [Spirochaetota bacterium]HPN14191.1 FapA family protein [Spirochaetota bacterium]